MHYFVVCQLPIKFTRRRSRSFQFPSGTHNSDFKKKYTKKKSFQAQPVKSAALAVKRISSSERGMAPALTKVLKNGHGIHLHSAPASVRTDSEGTAACSTELQPHMRSKDGGDLQQKMWLNLSSFRSLDSCLPISLLDAPARPQLSACPQTPATQCETMFLPSPNSLTSLLSSDSHQVALVFPDVRDMFLVPHLEHNRQQAYQLDGWSAAYECGPDGGDVHCSSLNPTSVCPSYPQGDFISQGHTHLFSRPPSLTQEKVAGMGCSPPASVQPCIDRVNLDQLTSKAVLEEAVKEQLSRQAGLSSRVSRLQKRLQTLLGEHALRHCNQQLEGLTKHSQLGDLSLDCPKSIHSPQASGKPHFPWLELFTASSSVTEVREFSQSCQVVLRGPQEALDSEATASSSSDEEPEEEKLHSIISPISSSCGRQWLEERAEIGSRCSWLELRLEELEGRIAQLTELHKHIHSTKGGVVLADSQPLTDRQIQQTLLRETAGLSCAASDADNEPCSPEHLLHNIQRQSAQLSQMVNSLIPPLSFSPPSKQPQTCKSKRTLTSGQKGNDIFVSENFWRRRLGLRKRFKADASCICARTRPLVTYHKRRLFTFSCYSSNSLLESGKSMSTHSSLLSSPSCSCCSCCDPVVPCPDPDCSHSRVLSSSNLRSQPDSVSTLSFGTPLRHNLQKVQAREVWSQRPLVINTSANYEPHSSTPKCKSPKCKQHARDYKNRIMGLPPVRLSGSAQSQHSRVSQRKRKRRGIHRLLEDEEDVLYQLSDLEESSDDVPEESYTHVSRKQASQGFFRQRQRESMYNIDDIVFPMSQPKVEKLPYKDISIPSWRVVDTHSLTKMEPEKEGEIETEQVEDLSDEVFAQRHMVLEQKEKLCWSSWDKKKSGNHLARSGSRLLGSGGGMYTSGEESSAERSCSQLDADDLLRSEEWLPQPWEPRVFPLDEDEEVALLSDKQEKVPSGWMAISSASSTSKHSNSPLAPAQSSFATVPSVGQSKKNSS